MSESESFINEVTEEVRRDRLFRLARRYGWIAVVAVLVIVGAAAVNEWRKAQADKEGILAQVPYQDKPVRYEYRLTIKGEDLYPGGLTLL